MSVVWPFVQDFSRIRERVTFFPQMENVLQELSIGIKVIDTYDDDVLCLNHIHEEDLQEDNELSVTSARLMQNLKRRTSVADIPITLINKLDAARLSNGTFQKSKTRRREWLRLFRSPSSTDAKRCSQCYEEKLKLYSMPFLLNLGQKLSISSNRSWYNQSVPNSARSAVTPTQQAYQEIEYGKGSGYRSVANSIASASNDLRFKESNRTEKSTITPKASNQQQKAKPSIAQSFTVSLANPQLSQRSECCNSKCSDTSTISLVPNNGSASAKSGKYGDCTSCELKSETSSVTRSIQCSLEMPAPGDHVVYHKGYNADNNENMQIYENDGYSIQANASTISSSSSRYQKHACSSDDLDEGLLEYVKSQHFLEEQQLDKLNFFKREKMEVNRAKSHQGSKEVSKSVTMPDSPTSVANWIYEEDRVDSASVSSSTVVYKTTPVKKYRETSTLNSYLVHRLCIPPNPESRQNMFSEENPFRRLSKITFPNAPRVCRESVISRGSEKLKRKQRKPESKYEDQTVDKRKNFEPVKKFIGVGDGTRLPTRSKTTNHQTPKLNTYNVSQHKDQRCATDFNRRVVKISRIEIGHNDILLTRRKDLEHYEPLMPASEPIMRARARMYPTTREPAKIIKEKYDDEFDLTSKDFIEKFLTHFNNHNK